MFNQALLFLVEVFLNLFLVMTLLRFYMQALRAPFYNPVGQFVIALTDFAVKPLRRVIPGWRGLDLATLLLAWVAALALESAAILLQGYAVPFGQILLFAIVTVLRMSLTILVWVMILQALLSWVSPQHWLAGVVGPLARPFSAFFRRFIPPLGGVDLSPLFVIIAAQLVLAVVLPPLETAILN